KEGETLSENSASKSEAKEEKVMKPWLNSNLDGVVTKEVTSDLKDDFYLNINHDWLVDTKFRSGQNHEDCITDMKENVKKRCIDILEDDSLTGDDAELAQGLYKLLMDWDTRNELGIRPYMPLIEKIMAIKDMDMLNEYLISEEGLRYDGGLIQVSIGIDSNDSDWYNVEIYPSFLSLGDSDEYTELSEYGKALKEYNEEIYDYMFERVGINDEEGEKIVEDLNNFEAELAEHMMSTTDYYKPESLNKIKNPVTLEEINEISPNYPLTKVIGRMGLSQSNLINLSEPDWLKRFNELYNEENLDGIKAKILTLLLSRIISEIDEEAFDHYCKCQDKLNGIEEPLSKEERCYEIVKGVFPDSLSRLYLEKYMDVETREEVTGLCEEVIATYKDMIKENEWLSEETKKAAINKLDKLNIQVAYPEKWDDSNIFYFTSKEDGGNLIEAYDNIARQNRLYAATKINSKIDKEKWMTNTLDVNAANSQQQNTMYIYSGILQGAIYNKDMSTEEKLAQIGFIIGHEISHAFDSSGSQYDEAGNIKKWWTDKDYKEFEKKSKKVVDYYNDIIISDDGKTANGDLYLLEAIADMGGVECMLRMASKIDDFDYDKFFRSYASGFFRSKSNRERIHLRAASDPHPFEYLRVNVTLQQFDEFFLTYDIKEGDGMYLAPEDRIAIW
nr:M13 family metallopeptidase [Lachnospiraceae bacterium]